MKQWIALSLAVLMTLALFTGCGQPQQAETASDTPAVLAGDTYTGDTLADGIKAMSACTVEDLTADDPRLDEIVATCGDYSLSNRVLQFYFWMAYLNFANSISGYGMDMSLLGLDTSKPMSEQDSLAENLNWEQYFISSALDSFRQNASVAMEAKAEGFAMPDDVQEYLDGLEDELATQATAYGYTDAESFIQASFGPGANAAGYREYVELVYYAGSYENSIYDTLEYTDEELAQYFNDNAEAFAEDGVTMDSDIHPINVRHILIDWEDADGDGTPTEEEKAVALAEAERILAEYEEDPSEEHFAELANQYSTDPGSNTKGGLYENVTPGYMVEPFNDWCFDAVRQAGDTGIVETTYGYHLMFFVSESDTPYWKQYVLDNGYLTNKMDQLVDEMGSQHDISVILDRIVLGKAPIYA